MVQRDEELIERANEGDAAGSVETQDFASLYRRHRDWVYRLAWRFTGNQADALDVMQETFMYLLGKFPGFRLTASMTTFLYPVVKHLALNTRRRRSPNADEEILTAIPDPAAPAASQTRPCETSRAELAAALAALSDEHREVVLMRFVDDMTLDEIAAALAIPAGTVKSRLHRALETLRTDPRARDYFLP